VSSGSETNIADFPGFRVSGVRTKMKEELNTIYHSRNHKPGNIWLDELVCSGSETNIANAAPATLKLPASQLYNRCRGTNLKCAGTNGF